MKILFLFCGLLVFLMTALGQSEDDLVKATQNPLAAMYSLPFQNNTTFGNAPIIEHKTF